MKEYLGTRYPALRKQAEESGAIIYFIDETAYALIITVAQPRAGAV